MVLTDLGRKINASLASLATRPKIDEAALAALLRDLSMALLEADVSARLVSKLRTNIKSLVDLDALAKAPAANQRRLVQKAVFDELVRLVDPGGVKPWQPAKGKCNVVMFVGLQGSGKTTSCTKLAYYYQRKGWKTGLVCTDTFRAGAFDQLKQNAAKAKVPFYGSYTETDPVRIAQDGVERFKREKFELVVIDTSGCHVTEEELFGEMTSIASVIVPDNVIFVMDGTIGQSAEVQAKNFKDAVNVGSIIMTKMDGHAKGGGAISAVAATGSPIIFIGTGEHIQDLDRFDSRAFISKMMGFGDLGGLMEKIQDLKLDEKGFMKNVEQGKFTLRDMREQMQNMLSLGPMSKLLGMMPGMPADLVSQMGGNDEMGAKRMRKMMAVMDSMTDAELDGDGSLFETQPTRVTRVARGSGAKVNEVQDVLRMHGTFKGMVKGMGGMGGWMQQMKALQGGGAAPNANSIKGMNPVQLAKMQKQMRSKMSPEMLKQMRAMAAANGGKPPADMNEMMALMGGAGGGGIGGMAEMMQSMMGGGGAGAGGGGMGGMAEMMQSIMGGAGGGGGGMADMMKAMMGGGGGGMADMMKNLGGLMGGLGGAPGVGPSRRG